MPLMKEYNKDAIKESIFNKLLRYYGVTLEEATPKQIYAAVASTVRDQIMLKWRFEKEERLNSKAKRLYYLSIEFLTGRWLHNNLLNLCSTEEYVKAFDELGEILDEYDKWSKDLDDWLAENDPDYPEDDWEIEQQLEEERQREEWDKELEENGMFADE